MEWTLDKINQYITNGIEENLHLDYKGAHSLEKNDKKKDEISKDISAFANSDGGVIIFGIKEFDIKDKRHLPEKLDPIDGLEFNKEWLEDVINSRIAPRIPNIIITPIQILDPQENQVIYVIEIPKSNTAHQAHDKKYYKRFNFKSEPMEDWEIKDIINRQQKTNIQIKFYPSPLLNIDLAIRNNLPIDFDIYAKNISNRITSYVNCFISGNHLTAKSIIKPRIQRSDFEYLFCNEKKREIVIQDTSYIIGTDRIPILPQTEVYIGDITLAPTFITNNLKLHIQIATEDCSRCYMIQGKDILNQI